MSGHTWKTVDLTNCSLAPINQIAWPVVNIGKALRYMKCAGSRLHGGSQDKAV